MFPPPQLRTYYTPRCSYKDQSYVIPPPKMSKSSWNIFGWFSVAYHTDDETLVRKKGMRGPIELVATHWLVLSAFFSTGKNGWYRCVSLCKVHRALFPDIFVPQHPRAGNLVLVVAALFILVVVCCCCYHCCLLTLILPLPLSLLLTQCGNHKNSFLHGVWSSVFLLFPVYLYAFKLYCE